MRTTKSVKPDTSSVRTRVNAFDVALRGRGSLFETLRMTIAVLTAPERKRGMVVLVMVALMALIETLGVASIMPFLAVLGNPGIIEQVPIMHYVYEHFGFESSEQFLFALGVMAFIVVVGASAFKALTHYVMHRYTYMRRHSISERLLASYLRQPYTYFLNTNSAVLSKAVLSEVDQLVNYVFKPAMHLVGYGATVIVLVALLLVVNPMVALMVGSIVGGLYLAIYFGIRDVSSRLGRDRVNANKARFTTASEAFGGIKEVKVFGREEVYLKRFRSPSLLYSRHQTTSSVLSDVPKNLIEAVGFGGIIALTLWLMSTRGNLGEMLAVLGVYAFAGYRLLPAAQHVYSAVAKLRFGYAIAELVYKDLRPHMHPAPVQTNPDVEPIHVRKSIRFEQVTFAYPGATGPSLKNIDMEIPLNSEVGIVGSTGAGKTTVVDMLLGLLLPTSGAIRVDDTILGPADLPRWRKSIGYVPQHIYLADASVAENIAFGIPGKSIDRAAIERAARAAQLHDFVTQELGGGYDTKVGERGIRLSGGQRQRIGIARALYHDPQILVLDEATSALDNITETAVMAAIDALSGTKTIIMVAHRLSTVRNCDRIFLFENGRVAMSGRYDDVRHRLGA